jgi:hypothetical protein
MQNNLRNSLVYKINLFIFAMCLRQTAQLHLAHKPENYLNYERKK